MSLELRAKTLFTVKSNGPFIYDPRNNPFAIRNEVQYFSNDSFAESANSRSSTPGTALAVPTQNYLRFTVDDSMKDEGTGFVFGNNPDLCDVYVYGVSPLSEQLFAITINHSTGAPLLKNLARRGINVASNSLGRKRLTTMRALVSEEYVEVVLPDFDIVVTVTDHSDHEDLHERYRARFCARLARSMPGLAALNVKSHQSSAKHHDRDAYILGRELGRGVFGVVYRATHYRTGDAFAVKAFHKTDLGRPLQEAAILQQLRHVCIIDSPSTHITKSSSSHLHAVFTSYRLTKHQAKHSQIRRLLLRWSQKPLPLAGHGVRTGGNSL